MSVEALQLALEGLSREDLGSCSEEELEEDLLHLERLSGVLEAERARRVAELCRRRRHREDGHPGVVPYLARRLGVAPSTASRYARLARALQEAPGVGRAMAEGKLPAARAQVLLAAVETSPEAFRRDEARLVSAAEELAVPELRRELARWQQQQDPQGAAEAARRLYQRRRLFLCSTPEGMLHVDGDLDPETGAVVQTALASLTDAWGRDGKDPRTPAQRRADALGEICRRHLQDPDRPRVGGERPHLVLRVEASSLGAGTGEVPELVGAGPVTLQAAHRIACDASVVPVPSGPSGALDLGRRTPVVGTALRRAVVERDRGCRFPGCGRPTAWCEVHHVRHWAHGGTTSLANLVLLCRFHHRLVHEGGFGVEAVGEGFRFLRPDGTVLPDRGPP